MSKYKLEAQIRISKDDKYSEADSIKNQKSYRKRKLIVLQLKTCLDLEIINNGVKFI